MLSSKGCLKITIIICATLFHLMFYSFGHAGVALDGTMGTKGPLTGPNYAITPEMGKQVGDNLFQSFSIFNINTGESATFTGPSSIENVISRVTGGSASNIDGTLRSDIQGANFFFINPSGVIFGPNANLDVSGSFHVSTADYIKLDDGGRFDARTPANSVLSSAPPSAFGFLSDSPKDISVNGSFLKVPEGETLSLVGGNLGMQNGTLFAPGGTINLVSVAAQGEANFSGPNLNVDSFGNLGTITISDNRSYSERPVNDDGYVTGNVDVSDAGGGIVYIRGGEFVMDKAFIFADTYADTDGRGIDIKITGETNIGNFSWITAETFGKGKAGDITIETNNLVLTGASEISTNAQEGSEGNGGDIKVTAHDTVSISGYYDSGLGVYSSGLKSETFGRGNAGNITIVTNNLNITDNGSITTSAREGSEGNGGDIKVTALNTVSISGHYENGQGVFSSGLMSETFGKGSAGNITVDTNDLSLTDSGFITTSAREGSEGNGGNISITARDNVSISGYHDSGSSNYSSVITSETFGKGRAGDIAINTNNLSITDDGSITTSAREGSEGDGGNITIKAADSISISGSHILGNNIFFSGIFSETSAKGKAGDITIETGNLNITEAGRITTSAREGSEGNGGNISVTARDNVSISGYHDSGNTVFPSGLTSETFGKGSAGNIMIDTNNLNITDAGFITTSTREGSEGEGGNITIKAADTISISGYYDSGQTVFPSGLTSETYGKGSAGNIMIDTNNLSVTDAGCITTSTWGWGEGGDITIKAADTVSISGTYDSEQVFYSSGLKSETYGLANAGNITIDTNNLSITDGLITTSTWGWGKGDGGDITIRAADTVSISGYYDNGQGVSSSCLMSETYGLGNAGNITIDTNNLSITDSGFITTSTWGKGEGGNITVKAADTVSISGYYVLGDFIISSGIFSETYETGKAGDITIDTGILSITDTGFITTSTWSMGDGGNINIKAADAVNISGHYDSGQGIYLSGLMSETYGLGNAGNITIDTNNLSITDSGFITTSTLGEGDGGNISVKARESVTISGHYFNSFNVRASNISSETYGIGKAGDISIETGNLDITDGGYISTSAREGSEGDGGNIIVKASDAVSISGHYERGLDFFSSGIFSEISGIGKAGDITIETGDLNIADTGRITTTARPGSEGDAGNISITARDKVSISGYQDSGRNIYPSVITSETFGKGDAGDITIDTNKLSITDEGSITTSAREGSEGDGGNISVKAGESVAISGHYFNRFNVLASNISSETYGIGKAGDISIETGNLGITDGGYISTSAREGSEGDGGNITVKAVDTVNISGNYDSGRSNYSSGIFSITTSIGKGGAISVSGQSIYLQDKGLISASSIGTGNAGNISISSSDILSVDNAFMETSSFESAGGNIKIAGEDIQLTNGGWISASVASGEGGGGNVDIDATTLVALQGSAINASADMGYGGNITINSEVVLFSDDIYINASSNLVGREGKIEVNSPAVDILSKLVVLPSSYLDVNALFPKQCAVREEEISSFVVRGRDGIPPQPDSLLTSP